MGAVLTSHSTTKKPENEILPCLLACALSFASATQKYQRLQPLEPKTGCSIQEMLNCTAEIDTAVNDCGHLNTIAEIEQCINDVLGATDWINCICDIIGC